MKRAMSTPFSHRRKIIGEFHLADKNQINKQMKKFKVAITIEAETPETVQKVGNLIQNAVNKVEQKDIIRLLEKVSQNPGIVKTALKFI
jgi:hypothetical protein